MANNSSNPNQSNSNTLVGTATGSTSPASAFGGGLTIEDTRAEVLMSHIDAGTILAHRYKEVFYTSHPEPREIQWGTVLLQTGARVRVTIDGTFHGEDEHLTEETRNAIRAHLQVSAPTPHFVVKGTDGMYFARYLDEHGPLPKAQEHPTSRPPKGNESW